MTQGTTLDPPCPRCGGPSSYAYDVSDRNRNVSDGRFRYQRCDLCGVTWLLDVPDSLSDQYPAGYHDFSEGDELAAAVAREMPRLSLIQRYVSGGQLVELGPSQGVFATAARSAGFEVVGLEMDPECCRHLEEVVGVRAINTMFPADVLATLPSSRAIVMWHVIEHLPDLWGTLGVIARNLEPGGVFAVATPNPRSFGARLLRTRWVHIDAPRHLTLIPLPALCDAASVHGLNLETATSIDPIGLILNSMTWQRSLLTAPTLRDNPRLAYTIGRVLGGMFGPIERRGLRGAAYTAVFRKQN